MSDPVLTAAPNARWNSAMATLSVLIPFHGHDPAPLLRMLDREAQALAGRVEIVLLDDGNPVAAVSEAAAEAVAASPLPATLLTLRPNEGRSKGRNRLAAAARAPYFLFLDSDMAPDAPDFLARWLALIEESSPACAVGGFSLTQTRPSPEHALHAALQARAECAPVEVRRGDPAKYVYTSNLLVRRDVFEAEAFDESFTGWGWEDVEWGMRVAVRFGVTHVDNPASHLGLDTAPQLAKKYAQSAANFARVLARHPAVVKAYPSYRAARALSHVPGHGVLGAAFRGLALTEAAPLSLRVAAMKLHRAALYARVV